MKHELIQVSKRVRVESGAARKKAIATPELLSDEVTATHYQAGQKDALGKPIKLGEELDYLDWLGKPVWYVYRLEEVTVPLPGGKVETRQRYMPKGCHEHKADALVQAKKLGG